MIILKLKAKNEEQELIFAKSSRKSIEGMRHKFQSTELHHKLKLELKNHHFFGT